MLSLVVSRNKPLDVIYATRVCRSRRARNVGRAVWHRIDAHLSALCIHHGCYKSRRRLGRWSIQTIHYLYGTPIGAYCRWPHHLPHLLYSVFLSDLCNMAVVRSCGIH